MAKKPKQLSGPEIFDQGWDDYAKKRSTLDKSNPYKFPDQAAAFYCWRSGWMAHNMRDLCEE